MGANIAGIYGAQIFRADDKPKYRRGFSIGIAVLATGITLAIIRYVDGILRRKRTEGRLQTGEGSSSEENNIGGEKIALPPAEDQAAPIVFGNDTKPVVANKLV